MSAALAPSAARSTYREYASRTALGRRRAAGPFSSLQPERFSDRLLGRKAQAMGGARPRKTGRAEPARLIGPAGGTAPRTGQSALTAARVVPSVAPSVDVAATTTSSPSSASKTPPTQSGSGGLASASGATAIGP